MPVLEARIQRYGSFDCITFILGEDVYFGFRSSSNLRSSIVLALRNKEVLRTLGMFLDRE